MRRLGLTVAAAALLALPACGGDGDPVASPSATTPPPATGSSAPPSPSATASLPPGCTAPAPLPAGATLVEVTVAGGKVTSGGGRRDVPRGTPVRLVVTADVADEVHVHSYDLYADTKPGCPAVLDFEARIPGAVEVELESSHLEIVELRAS